VRVVSYSSNNNMHFCVFTCVYVYLYKCTFSHTCINSCVLLQLNSMCKTRTTHVLCKKNLPAHDTCVSFALSDIPFSFLVRLRVYMYVCVCVMCVCVCVCVCIYIYIYIYAYCTSFPWLHSTHEMLA
jgi:hypothetical protein